MSTPLVSIIIPTYNREALINATLDSVLVQTYTNWECIIVDDGSTDNTVKVVQEYLEKDSRFKFFHRPENSIKGASSCRNIGLSYSKGDYNIFLDSDDVLLDYCLHTRVSRIKEFANCNFWVFPMYVQNENQNIEIHTIPPSDSYLIDFLSYRIRWQTMCTLWDTNFIKQIKGFNDLYPRLNDPEVHIRAMILSKNNFHIFNDVLADTVYFIDLKRDKYKFAQKYGNSLLLFIPDIKAILEKHGLYKEIKFLKSYLIDYFLGFYNYNSRRNNSRVVKAFYKNDIISFKEYLCFLIGYNLFLISNYGTKKLRENLLKRITNL